MLQLPILAISNFSEQFEVTADALGTTVWVVLSQKGHPIAFFSKKMCVRMSSSSTYVRELYAIIEAIKKWRQYLIGPTYIQNIYRP